MKRVCWKLASVVILIGGLSFLGAAQTSDAKKLKLTPEQAIAIRQVEDLHWSPDGSRLAFTVAEVPKGAEHLQHIWIYRLGTGELRQFTHSAKSETHPRWSPDGKTLSFLSKRSDAQQIYVIPTDGGEASDLMEGKQAVENFEWSPDGKSIAYLAPVTPTEAEGKKEKDKDDARSVDRDDKRTHLWLLDVATRKTREVVGTPWEFSELQWLPSGNALVVIATDRPESDQETKRIFVVNPSDGKMQLIQSPQGPFEQVRVSRDGTQIAYIASRVDGPSPHDLYVMPSEGGAAKNLTAASIDRPVEQHSWRVDGKWVVSVSDGFHNKFMTLDAAGHAQPLLAPGASVSNFAESDSGRLAFVAETSTAPRELWMWDGKAPPQKVSSFNSSFEQYALFAPEFVRYKSFDGREIEGALLKPAGYDGKSKLPAVLLIHGGPTGNWDDRFEAWGQLLASAGYAVFYPNVRGSTGYGYQFSVLNRGDWGGGDFKDVMAGADFLIARGIADPDRLGIAGWSYGGFMSEWAITQTQRFKAAVTGAGLSDLASEYGTEKGPSYDEWFYGLPYEKPEGFRRSSPITYVKNARTPTLILQGEEDVIDPPEQSQLLYRALKRYGVPTELVLYPRERHSLREEKHLTDRLRRIVAWFDRYLKPGGEQSQTK